MWLYQKYLDTHSTESEAKVDSCSSIQNISLQQNRRQTKPFRRWYFWAAGFSACFLSWDKKTDDWNVILKRDPRTTSIYRTIHLCSIAYDKYAIHHFVSLHWEYIERLHYIICSLSIMCKSFGAPICTLRFLLCIFCMIASGKWNKISAFRTSFSYYPLVYECECVSAALV